VQERLLWCCVSCGKASCPCRKHWRWMSPDWCSSPHSSLWIELQLLTSLQCRSTRQQLHRQPHCSTWIQVCIRKVKGVCSSLWQPISELHSVACRMGSHCVTWHRWTCPTLTSAKLASAQFAYSGGMEGWVDLGIDCIARWFTCPQTVTQLQLQANKLAKL